MSTNILDQVKERLKRDFHDPGSEWEYVKSSLPFNESERQLILKWVFLESPAYWETRAKAGLILLEENERETWSAIEKLVESPDPDDNGTALTIFEYTHDPRGPELAQKWLSDNTHPATRLEAINFLKDIYPDDMLEK